MDQPEIFQGLYDNTVLGRAPEVTALTQAGLDQGLDPVQLLYSALLPALQEVGRRFEVGEFFVPEMLMSARAMQGALNLLRPLLAARGEKTIGKFVMGTVKGDVHDIGKNLCNIMLEGAGFEVIDLGVNVPPDKFVEAVRTHQPQLLGMSAFLTTTMPMFKVNIEALKAAGLRDQVKIMCGGAPVTAHFAEMSGADAYCPDASATARRAAELIGAASTPPDAALADAVAAVENMMKDVEE